MSEDKALKRYGEYLMKQSGQTIGDWIKQYETPQSKAHKSPDWETLQRLAWEGYERWTISP